MFFTSNIYWQGIFFSSEIKEESREKDDFFDETLTRRKIKLDNIGFSVGEEKHKSC